MSKTSKQEIIKSLLESAFNIHLLEITNESYMHNVPKDSETHFKVILVSNDFTNLALVKRHKAVYETLKDIMNQIHALSLHIFDIDEYKLNQDVQDSPQCLN